MNTRTYSAMIEQLNGIARNHAANGMDATDALEAAASELDLTEVARSDDEQCRIYEYGEGVYFNCWFEGVIADDITDGGMGFDDQIEWWVE